MVEVTLKQDAWGKKAGETKKVSTYKAAWAEKSGLIEPITVKALESDGYDTKHIVKAKKTKK